MLEPIRKDYPLKEQLIQVMIDNEGSDMYITVGAYPSIKIGGEIVRIDDGIEILKSQDTLEFAESLITPEQHEILLETKNLDFSFSCSERRFRCNISFQLGNYMIVLRLLTAKIPQIKDLGLTDAYMDVTKVGQGLVLVTGPTGSGKTTTLAAMIDYINSHYNKHLITIEDPIEYVHKNKKSIIEHKEIGRDIPDYITGLIGAMRQNPQVLLFGEMRTRREMEMALTLAETGHLVFSTLHTRSAHQTISRILDSFPGEQQNQVRLQLADSLVAIFSQRLLKSEDGTGVKLAKEVLIKTGAIANLIRENDLHQIPSLMQMGSRDGMQILEDDIVNYIVSGVISEEEGFKYSNNPKFIKEKLGL
ncbi:type IV pili twitching motility protein PilT [Candidatus Gracilibacteria bacterium]|nr:MAG: type IV pili twitching motility protein PilT [Candidatus Gracilibacteria bacterium]